MNEEKDFLQDAIAHFSETEPGFAEIWAPYVVMGKLIDERIRLGLTQADVAQAMGIRQPAIAKMENEPSGVAFARVLAYAKTIGVPITVGISSQDPKGSPTRPGRPAKAA